MADSVDKMVGVMLAFVVGALTLLSAIYILPEVQTIIDNQDSNVTDSITGYGLLEQLGMLVLVFGGIIAVVVLVLREITGQA